MSAHGGESRSGEVTLPYDGAYRLTVAIRPDGARMGLQVDVKIDSGLSSRLNRNLAKRQIQIVVGRLVRAPLQSRSRFRRLKSRVNRYLV